MSNTTEPLSGQALGERWNSGALNKPIGSGGVPGIFVGLAWLKARVQSGELFKSVSKELCELGLELSQLERV